jgi:hypothetical protein
MASTAERVRAHRERKGEEGWVRLEVVVHRVDVEKVKKEIAATNAYRARMLDKYGEAQCLKAAGAKP